MDFQDEMDRRKTLSCPHCHSYIPPYEVRWRNNFCPHCKKRYVTVKGRYIKPSEYYSGLVAIGIIAAIVIMMQLKFR
jgi:hypothetical protein